MTNSTNLSRLQLNESFFSKEVRHYEFICNTSTCHWNISVASFVIEKWLFSSATSSGRKKWFNAAYVTVENDPKWRRRKLEMSEYTLRVCRPKCFLDRLGFRYENEKIDDFFKGIEDFVHFRTKENVWTFFMFKLQASKKKDGKKN